MLIGTFNVNSIRARLEILTHWIEKVKPHILCLQETKVQDTLFPVLPFKELGYEAVFRGEKGYNGVAILSRLPIESAGYGFEDNSEDTRLIHAKISGLNIINTYVPQGYMPDSDKFRYKIGFLEKLYNYITSKYNPEKPVIWTGDFNIAPTDLDVYAPEVYRGSVGFHPEEHRMLDRFKDWGMVDIFRMHNSNPGEYSFFDYTIRNAVKRKMGWRIDHIWGTRVVAEASKSAWIDLEPRLMKKPSDHTPVLAEL
ncbi:MAG: exodeoxyribonuclease III [Nitrospirae bacterium]|nr:MAG: exodeoxyribonuclease III [Nitrospirota bacterium]